MMKLKLGLIMAAMCLLVMIVMPVSAQVEESQEENISGEETGDQGGGFMDTLFKAIGGAAEESLEEGIEELAGTYKGRIVEVSLLERRGNAIVLQVKYKDIKRDDGVYVQGEILKWGEPLEGFSSTLSSVQGRKGSVNLTIGWQGGDTSGWDLPSEEGETSDQIRLSLVRETNPERPFGILVYDLNKTWTNSSEPEVLEDAVAAEDDSSDAIELAEGETPEGSQSAPSLTLTKPMLLHPVATGSAATAQPAPPTANRTSRTPAAPAAGMAIATRPMTLMVTNYNLYENAKRAQWRSAKGILPYPGSPNDNRGFVRTLSESTICPNNKAMNLLQTHPQWVNNGWIEGRYPEMTLGKNVKFKAVGAMLKGANSSDGVKMEVTVLDNGRHNRVVRKRVDCKGYTHFEADLSKWAGKTVQILLRVKAGKTSTQDWAVWVNPRLESK